tara:strand:- start:2312 stop:2587 length:276 start_codon:yes stop_codon:yes gene_type:complete
MTLEIYTDALDVSKSELENMTTEQRVDEQCYNIFGDNDWSYVSCGQSGWSKEDIEKHTSSGEYTLCKVKDIDDYEFKIMVYGKSIEEVSDE